MVSRFKKTPCESRQKTCFFLTSFVEKLGGGNSNIFGIVSPRKFGEDESILTSIFSKGLKPPTRKICVCSKDRSR